MNMFDKKYRIVSIESKKFNPVHDDMRESVWCCPAYFKVGERGWFLFMENGTFVLFAHRVHTSPVKEVIYEENRITVQTENTTYVFEVMEDERF